MFKKTSHEANIDEIVDGLLEELGAHTSTTDEYATIVKRIAELKDVRNKNSISKETLATIGANLVGIAVILQHERAHVVASKAFGLVKKLF